MNSSVFNIYNKSCYDTIINWDFNNKNNKTKNIPIAYSLGNFVSNQRDQYKNGGIGVGLNLSISNGIITFTDWSFLPFWVRVRHNPNGFYLIPVSDWEKNPGKYNLSTADIEKIRQFGKDTRTLLNGNKEMKKSD